MLYNQRNNSSAAGQQRTPSQAIAAALRTDSSDSSSSSSGSGSKESVPVLVASKATRARHNRGNNTSSISAAVAAAGSNSNIIIKSPAAVDAKQAWKVNIAPPVLDTGDSASNTTTADSAAVTDSKGLKQENEEPAKGAAKRRKKGKADVQVDAVEVVAPVAETAAAAVKPRRTRSRAVKG